jgi:hypothetical protein
LVDRSILPGMLQSPTVERQAVLTDMATSSRWQELTQLVESRGVDQLRRRELAMMSPEANHHRLSPDVRGVLSGPGPGGTAERAAAHSLQ